MKSIIAATAVALFSINAQAGILSSIVSAFTEKSEVSKPVADECNGFSCSGWVVSDGKKMKASESPSGKAALEKDGYLVSSGYLFVQVDNYIVETELSKLSGKQKPEIVDQIKTDAKVQIKANISGSFNEAAAKAESQAEMIEQLAAEGIVTLDLDNMSIDQAVEAAVENGGSFAVDGDISEAVANDIADRVNESMEIDWSEVAEGTDVVEINGQQHERP